MLYIEQCAPSAPRFWRPCSSVVAYRIQSPVKYEMPLQGQCLYIKTKWYMYIAHRICACTYSFTERTLGIIGVDKRSSSPFWSDNATPVSRGLRRSKITKTFLTREMCFIFAQLKQNIAYIIKISPVRNVLGIVNQFWSIIESSDQKESMEEKCSKNTSCILGFPCLLSS